MMFSEDYVGSKNWQFRLSREQIDTLKKVFDVFDSDCDGLLEVSSEFANAVRAGGLVVDEKELLELVREADPLNTGFVDITTYFLIMARKLRDEGGKTDAKVELALKKMGIQKGDKSVISLQDLRTQLTTHGSQPLSGEDTEEFVNELKNLGAIIEGYVDIHAVLDELLRPIKWPPKSDQTATAAEMQLSPNGAAAADKGPPSPVDST